MVNSFASAFMHFSFINTIHFLCIVSLISRIAFQRMTFLCFVKMKKAYNPPMKVSLTNYWNIFDTLFMLKSGKKKIISKIEHTYNVKIYSFILCLFSLFNCAKNKMRLLILKWLSKIISNNGYQSALA